MERGRQVVSCMEVNDTYVMLFKGTGYQCSCAFVGLRILSIGVMPMRR